MNSINTIIKKDRVGSEAESSAECPDCGSAAAAAVPVVTVSERTLWRCVREDCAVTRTTPAAERAALADTPAPERVLERLVDAADYTGNASLLTVAGRVAELYRDADIAVPDVDWTACRDRFERENAVAVAAGD